MKPSKNLQVLEIIKGTTVDGPGFRTSIYLAGCRHHCDGCHNPQSWDPTGGCEMTVEEIMDIVEEEDFDVTLSGGDPLYDPENLVPLVVAIKNNRRNLWIYTGFTWEEILNQPEMISVVKMADVVVDGPFIEDLRDPDLPFRGSSNQRIIDVQKSLVSGKVELFSRH